MPPGTKVAVASDDDGLASCKLVPSNSRMRICPATASPLRMDDSSSRTIVRDDIELIWTAVAPVTLFASLILIMSPAARLVMAGENGAVIVFAAPLVSAQ